MCLFPKLIKNPKYRVNKKNGGNIPPVLDERVTYVPIGCGNCLECLKKKAREWQTRILEEIRNTNNARFITLTFSDKCYADLANERKQFSGYPLDNQVATLAVRRFLERWRKKYKKSLKHWLVTELGGTHSERIHLHGIVWTDIDMKEVDRIWNYGYTWIGYEQPNGTIKNYVNEKTATYITKYLSKRDLKHKNYKPIILTSAGIGAGYTKRPDAKLNIYRGEETKEHYRTRTGHKVSMPIYWRNKIYTEEEREKLWLHKLDKQVRWIMGEKIDVSKGEEQYNKLLKYYQGINKELGYGSDAKDWEQIRYENEVKKLKQLTIINKENKKKKNNNK